MITEVTKLLGIQYPVIQGGMAWVAEHHLAAAVSEAGGLGLIGGANAPGEVVRQEIRKARELTALASSEHRRHRQSGFGMKSAKQKN